MPIKKLKHKVLPHPQKKQRATLLQSKAVFLYSLGALLIFSFFRQIPSVLPGILGYASNITVSDLLKYTNERREALGVGSLTLNPKLTQAAQKKAAHMFSKNYWAHKAPDGTEPWSFILGENYDYLYAGENLAKNFNDSSDVVEAWYKSPSHRDNLVSDKYTDVGFAVVNGVLDGYETTLVVQMFGRPRNAPAQVAVKGADNNSVSKATQTQGLERVEMERFGQPAMGPNQPLPKIQPTESKTESVVIAPRQPAYSPTPKLDVFTTTKVLILGFSAAMLSLFALDAWYSKKHAILKFTGHTFAHMAFLTFAIFTVYFALRPGRLI